MHSRARHRCFLRLPPHFRRSIFQSYTSSRINANPILLQSTAEQSLRAICRSVSWWCIAPLLLELACWWQFVAKWVDWDKMSRIAPLSVILLLTVNCVFLCCLQITINTACKAEDTRNHSLNPHLSPSWALSPSTPHFLAFLSFRVACVCDSLQKINWQAPR